MKGFIRQFESVPMECIASLKMLEGPLTHSVLRIKLEI